MKKPKACLNCRRIFSEPKCPACGESIATETIKGKVYIFSPEKSEISRNMKIKAKGEFAIKTK